MRASVYSICFFACILVGEYFGRGQAVDAGTLIKRAQLANSPGASSVIDAVPKCNAPVDHSCDDKSFDEIADQIGGGGLLSGAKTGVLGGAAGGLPGGLPGRRRRFAIPKGNPVPPAAANPGLLNAAGGAGQLANAPGISFISDPNGMAPTALQNKLHKCQEKTKPGGQFDDIKSQLASGDFSKLTNPSAINAGDQCKKFMDQEREQCNALKRQACAFLKGGVKDIKNINCALKDMVATAGKVHATNSACDTAQSLIKNPNNAGNTLQSGAKGVGTGLVMNQGANTVLG